MSVSTSGRRLVTCTLSSSNNDGRSIRLPTDSAADESDVEVKDQNWTGFYHVHFEESKGIIYESLDRKNAQEVIRSTERGLRLSKTKKTDNHSSSTTKLGQLNNPILSRSRRGAGAEHTSLSSLTSEKLFFMKRPKPTLESTRPMALDDCIQAVENAKTAAGPASGDKSRLSPSVSWLQLLPVLLSLDKTVNKDLNDYLHTLSHNLDDINTKVNYLINQHRRTQSNTLRGSKLQEPQFDSKRESVPETVRRAKQDILKDTELRIYNTEKLDRSFAPTTEFNRNKSDSKMNRIFAAQSPSPPSRVSRVVQHTEDESIEDDISNSNNHFIRDEFITKLKINDRSATKASQTVKHDIVKNPSEPKWASPFTNNRYFMKRAESKQKMKRDPMKWESIQEESVRIAKQAKLYKGKEFSRQNSSMQSQTAIKNKPTSSNTIQTIPSAVKLPPYIEGFRASKNMSINEFDRNIQLMKATTAQNRKMEREAKEMAQCTFKPSIINRRGSSQGANSGESQRNRTAELTFRPNDIGQR